MKLNTPLMAWLLKAVDRRRAPPQIPMSSNLASRNYFSLYLRGDSGEDFLFQRMVSGFAEVLVFDTAMQRYVHKAWLRIEQAAELNIYCKYYLGYYEHTFTSLRGMFVYVQSGALKVHYLWLELRQWLSNKRSVPTVMRHDLIRYIVDQWLQDRDFELYPFTRLQQKMPRGLGRHPQWRFALNREIALLDSLVATGDLELSANASRYIIKPKIIYTLEQLDIDQRRHRSANRIQLGLGVIAMFAAVATAVQAWPVLTSLWSRYV